MLRQTGDADRGTDEGLALGEIDRAGQLGDDPIGKLRQRSVGCAAPVHQHGKFVAAEPGDEGLRPQLQPQRCRHPDQQLITGGMAEGIVDLFEAVEVDEEQRAAAAFHGTVLDHVAKLPLEQRTVGKAGQRVAVGK